MAVNSRDRLPEAGSRRYAVLGDAIDLKVTSAESGDSYLIVELTSPAGGGPALLHTHPPQESFLVLEGVVTFFREVDGRVSRSTASTGEVVHVAAGQPHTFRNFADAPARMWAVYAPGTMMQAFFTTAGHALPPGAPAPRADADEIERVLEIGTQLGMRWLDPVPGR